MDKETANYLTHYKTLSSEEQGKVIRELVLLKKKPPYCISFNLDQKGITHMAKVVAYCQKNKIPYTPEKKGSKKVSFSFQDIGTRNEVLLGRMTL